MVADSFPDYFNAVVQLVLSLSLFFKIYYRFCHLDGHFLSIDAGCDGVMHEAETLTQSRAPGCVIGWFDSS